MKLIDQSESKLASYRKVRFDNGLTVIVAKRPNTRTFGMCVEVKVGMRDRNPHVAHLVEHLVLARVSQVCKRTDYLNGFTQFSKTRYFMSAHIDEFESGLEMSKLVLSPLEADKERTQREIKILSREFAEAGAAQLILNRELYRVLGGDQLSRNYKKAIDGIRLSITAEEANELHDAYYQPNKSVIAIVSPLDPIEVVEKLSGIVGGFENSGKPINANLNTELTKPKKQFHATWHPGMATVGVCHKMSPVDFMDRVALSFLNRILAGSGRLFAELRENNSLCYHAHSSFEFYDDTIWHLAFANVSPLKAGRAAILLDKVVCGVADPMSDEEFESKVVWATQLSEIAEEEKWDLLIGLLNWNEGNSKLLPPQEIKKAILELTPQSVADAARRFFSTENQHWCLIGRFGPAGFLTTKRLSSR